ICGRAIPATTASKRWSVIRSRRKRRRRDPIAPILSVWHTAPARCSPGTLPAAQKQIRLRPGRWNQGLLMQRLCWLGAVALVLGTLAGGQALAQSKPLRIIVPYTPGSGPDILSRLIGEQIGKANGPTVVVENRPGGGAMIGIDAAARSEPDGNTLLLAANAF